jgi:hypothetical protein
MQPKSPLKVVPLYESNFRDVAATLRCIADDVEKGCYGAVGTAGVVLLADQLEVFGMGLDSDGCSVACVLQAGATKLITPIVNHGT